MLCVVIRMASYCIVLQGDGFPQGIQIDKLLYTFFLLFTFIYTDVTVEIYGI